MRAPAGFRLSRLPLPFVTRRMAGLVGGLLGGLLGGLAFAAEVSSQASQAPFAQPDPGQPLGQPPHWTLLGGIDLSTGLVGEASGFEATASLRRDLVNPVTGFLGVRLEAQLLSRAGELKPGARILLDVPAFMLRGGVRWDPVEGPGPVVGMSVPARRGGWPLPGSKLEFGWTREGAHRFSVGLSIPLDGSLAGRTRPRGTGIRLPAATGTGGAAVGGAAVDAEAHGALLRSMNWIATLHNLYWFTDRTGIGASERVLRSRQILEMLELELAHREGERGGRPGYRGEVDHYHASLVASFARALDSDAASADAASLDAVSPTSASSGIAKRRAEAVTREARRAMLDYVILPYNATVGQPRLDDRLDGLVESGARVFAEALEASLPELDPAARGRALAVFHAWGSGIDGIRAELGRWTRDSRVQWLPLALVLHPSEHDSRAEVDALVEHAVGRAFTGGNELEYLDQNRFQSELVRSIREARRMHLLWIHDFRARRDDGDADRAGFEMVTNGYLPALIESVRRHDLGEPIPTFVILLDQYYYEENGGRAWMTLLERPLEGAPRLPGGPGARAMEARVAELQDELRSVVAASDRLAAAEKEHGPGWIERLVRVQVNITQPSDFSFRSESVLAFPVGADNLMRDHRKIMARDLDPADPWRGEVIVTGMGVGDHYADPGWDDRSLRVRGPGALPVLDEARAVLEAHGIKGEAIPEVLRRGSSPVGPDRPDGPGGPGDPPADRAEPPGARVLQLHNRTGLDAKEASFVQMLLYDLLPAGTVIYVPDSLWTSPEWMAQLVSAALRGCEVLIVAPALAHAPQPGFPSMSETRELLTALLVVEETLGRVVREAGGRIQVGAYARSTSTTDERGRVTELRHALLRDPGARTFVDLSLVEATGSPSTHPSTHQSTRTDSADARHPLLHGKTQLYAARELLDRLARAPELAPTLRAFEEGRISEDEASQAVVALATAAGSPELYLLVGSLNRNVRSMALDGEVVVIVSGAGATVGLLDFLLLSGAVRWLETPEELDALIPPVPEWKRLLGRWLLRII